MNCSDNITNLDTYIHFTNLITDDVLLVICTQKIKVGQQGAIEQKRRKTVKEYSDK